MKNKIQFPCWLFYLMLFLLGFERDVLFAQDYLANVQHFSLVEGLSHRDVFTIHQDETGFIWLGTKYGLNRFDGKEFKWWTKEKQGLLSNEIHFILEDAEGWLWLFNGPNWYHKEHPTHISLVHPVSGVVKSYEEAFGTQMLLPFEEIKGFIQGEDRTLYFTEKNGNEIFYYNPEEGFQKIQIEDGSGMIPFIGKQDGHLIGYYHNEDQLPVLRKINRQGTIIWESGFEKDIHFIKRIIPLNEGQYLITGQQSELIFENYVFDERKHQMRLVNKDFDKLISEILLDWKWKQWARNNTTQVWMHGGSEFQVLDTDNGLIYDFAKNHSNLAESDVYDICFDKDGNAWVGTVNGLFKITLNQNPFQQYLSNDSKTYNEETSYSCRGIWANDDQLVANTYRGRIIIDKENPSKPINLSPIVFEKVPFLHHSLAILKKQTGGFAFSDYVLIEQDDDFNTQLFAKFEIQKHNNLIWSLHEDSNNTLWLGSGKGIGYLDRTKGLLNYFPPISGYESLSNSTVHAFVDGENQITWLCTNSGLYAWRPNEEILQRYWTGGKGNSYIPHDDILHIHEDENGVLWLATGGGGLVKLDREGKEEHFRQFTIADGLSNNYLYAVYEDDFEKLWMSSNYGIIQFDKNELKARAYLPEDGITHYEFNRISHFMDDKGRIYFGGLNGITAFHPKEFHKKENEFDAPLVITNFQQWDGSSGQFVDKTNTFLQFPEITLQPGDRFFRVQFNLLHFQDPELNHYAWKIEGLDAEWNHMKENFIRMSGLPSGAFTLKVKGQASNGQWSINELNIPIRVLKPFYLKVWFFITLISSLFLVFFAWFNWRTKQLKKQKIILERTVKERTKTIEEQAEELRQLDKLKSRFFANVSHELRTPLTLMLAPIDSALKSQQLNDRNNTFLNIAKQSGQKLLNLVNEILDLTKIESGKLELNLKAANLHALTQRIITSFESYSESQQLKLALDYQAPQSLQIEVDIKKYEAILNNLLSNAFKFTHPGGKVTVVLRETGDKLQLSVADTGRGIHADDLPHVFDRFYQTKRPDAVADGGTGIGLALCSELAKCFGGKLWAESEEGQGSTFYFEFPRREVFEINAEEIEFDKAHSAMEEADLMSLPAQNGFPASKSKDRTILIVEDNEYLRDYLRTILDKYTIVTVNNGKEALDWLTVDGGRLKTETEEPPRHPAPRTPTPRTPTPRTPHLIISDVMMPQMDGFQLLNKLKTNDQFRHIPILMLTARAGKDDKLKALRIGVDDYMTKPFEQEELFVRVENLLKNNLERQRHKAESEMKVEGTLANSVNISAEDLNWLETTESTVKEQLKDPKFNTQALADALQISRIHLFRRLKNITGLSPSQYIKEARLVQARQLIENQTYDSIKAVAYSVGMHHLGSFASQFKARFGKSPSAFQSINRRSKNTLL